MIRLKLLISIILIFAYISSYANCNSVGINDQNSKINNFCVLEKSLDFKNSIRSGECFGTIKYPELLHDSKKQIFAEINDEIHDFAEIYSICNHGEHDNFSVNFDIPNSSINNLFSIRWITKNDGKLWHIDTLTFNSSNGDLVIVDHILDIFDNVVIYEIVLLSEGRLAKNLTLKEFSDQIESGQIQLYIKDKNWHMVFNPSKIDQDVLDVEIPKKLFKDAKFTEG